jgi:hypothetical protein
LILIISMLTAPYFLFNDNQDLSLRPLSFLFKEGRGCLQILLKQTTSLSLSLSENLILSEQMYRTVKSTDRPAASSGNSLFFSKVIFVR